MFKADVSLLS